MASIAGEAVLLRAVEFGESDLVVHLLTAETGRLTAIAKSARKSLRRFPGTLDLFNHLAIEGRTRPRGGMGFLERARLLDPHLGLRRDPARYALASFLVELLDRLSPESMEAVDSRPLFALTTNSLTLIEQVRPTPSLRILLELRVLDALGLRPELARCVRCGREPGEHVPDAHGVNFHVPDGGLVCSACARGQEGLVPIALGTLRALAAGLAVPIQGLASHELPADGLREAARLAFRFQRFHVGVELRSERFLDEVLPIAGPDTGPG
ncbi:DNA repair protein RecO [Myxococcota bacterium]|nr:DNA repair protein RecO [Myxococcota bacterium]